MMLLRLVVIWGGGLSKVSLGLVKVMGEGSRMLLGLTQLWIGWGNWVSLELVEIWGGLLSKMLLGLMGVWDGVK